MDPQLHTSFIPKAPVNQVVRARNPMSFLVLIAFVLFVISAAGWGGAFLYKKLLTKDVSDLKIALAHAKDAFEPKLLAEFERVDHKLVAARELLAKHTVVTPLFEELEKMTLPRVRFTNLAFNSRGQGGTNEITMTGEAKDYASIALQSDILAENEFVRNPVFSNLNVSREGNVTFSLKFSVTPELFSYLRYVDTDTPADGSAPVVPDPNSPTQ